MARLEAQSKLLYYPTPNDIVDLIATWFCAVQPVRLADPCCGTGEALRRFADALKTKTETWGVELSHSRAAQAAQVLDHVLPTSFYAMSPSKWSSASVGLLFNNPPYDWGDIVERDEKGRERRIRHELLFVENATRKIVSGGHQVIIIPRGILGDEHLVSAAMRERFARHVLGWYEQVQIMRFPDGEYERFKQVVVFATNKRTQYLPAEKEAIEAICNLAHLETDIPILISGNGDFVIPVAPEKVRFTYTPIEPAQLAQAANHCSPVGSGEYQRATYVRPLGASFNPALPLSVGHVTMLITGQETGVLEVEQDGAPALVKGMSRKVAVRKERDNEDAKGRVISTSITERERHEATLTVARKNSGLEMLADMESVGKFITVHATRITDAILAKNNPLYDFHPTPREWEVTGKSALGLPPLPGRNERGLFPVQRHFAIGAARVMRKHGAAIMNCEMGFGKAQPLDAKILTPTGWTTMQQIKVGDFVIGADGHPTQVVGVYPQGEKDIYRVEFSDGASAECCDDHLWTVNTPLRKWRGHIAKTLPLREIRHSLQHRNGNKKFYIPMVAPVEFDEYSLPLDPYVLGLLIGDGCIRCGSSPMISTSDSEILINLQSLLPEGFVINHSSGYDYRISYGKRNHFNPLTTVLKQVGLWGKRAETKFIPHAYKFSSVKTRLALLQGLLDTDGSSCGGTNVEFSSASKLLAEDVVFLVQSLGGIAIMDCRQPVFTYKGEKRKGQLAYRVTARFPVSMKPFRLTRKLATYVVRTKYADIPRAIVKVEYVGRKPAQCIKVANPDGLYVTDDFIVTHNTSVSISSLELLDKWPAIIMVPGHMVWKWKRDLERSSNSEAPITARVITRPVLSEPGRWTATKSAIEAKAGTVTSLLRWQVDPVTTNDPGGRLRVEIDCPTDKAGSLAALFAQFTLKDEGRVFKPAIQLTQTGLSAEYVDRDEYTLFDFVNAYKTGRLGRKAAAIIAFDPAKYDAGADERPAVQYHVRREFNEETNSWEHQRKACCPSCGHGYRLGSVPHFCSHEITDKVLSDGEVQERNRECGTPLFQMSRWRRVGLARLVQHNFRHFFKVYVGDESHKSQNGKTDIGVADQRLLSATRYSLALTGTLFGGTASSLFYLLYRRVPEIRRLYAFSDVTRWVDHYGLWERQWDELHSNSNKPREGDYGASTNIRRWNLRQRELPGIAPAVIRYLLPITLFGNITDLGYALPPVNELVETLEMPVRLAQQYEYIEREVLKEVMAMLDEYGDIGGLSAWFTACRFRPASAYRDERIDYSSDKGSEIHVELPAITSNSHPWLPKETRLAEIVRENMAQGRKTLVFVEQSGTRDIRSRLESVLENLVTEEAHVVNGRPLWVTSKPRVGILSASDMSPAKREAWIKINAPQMDVLVVNPKLVETGLDLVQFSSLIFFETTVSLYTLWQAMRRVWRLGQDKEVNVTFLAYRNTVEEEILRRMGQKKKAAQLLYGKEAAGVLVETDSDDLQREIIQAAIEGRAFRSAGDLAQSLFSDGIEKKVLVSTEPAGSLVAASLRMIVQHQEQAQEAVQMMLFGEVISTDTGVRRRRRR